LIINNGQRALRAGTAASFSADVLGPGARPQTQHLTRNSKSTKLVHKAVIKLLVAATVSGARVPELSFCVFLRRNPPQPFTTTNTPRTHCNTLLAPHRSVVLAVSSLAAFGKSPAARGSRNGPRTPPKRRSAAGTALGRNWGALPWGGGCLAGCCWCGGCLARRWGLGGGSVGPVRGSERRVFCV
jgi:hypothetical protein